MPLTSTTLGCRCRCGGDGRTLDNPAVHRERTIRPEHDVALDVSRQGGDDRARAGPDQRLIEAEEVRPGGRPLGGLRCRAQEAVDDDRTAAAEI